MDCKNRPGLPFCLRNPPQGVEMFQLAIHAAVTFHAVQKARSRGRSGWLGLSAPFAYIAGQMLMGIIAGMLGLDIGVIIIGSYILSWTGVAAAFYGLERMEEREVYATFRRA